MPSNFPPGKNEFWQAAEISAGDNFRISPYCCLLYTSFRREGKLLEAQRIEQRTRYDIEMLQEIGFCKGIENYSRVMAGREPGSAPFTLLDYFPKDYLLFVDESHVTLPQAVSYTHLAYISTKIWRVWKKPPAPLPKRFMKVRCRIM